MRAPAPRAPSNHFPLSAATDEANAETERFRGGRWFLFQAILRMWRNRQTHRPEMPVGASPSGALFPPSAPIFRRVVQQADTRVSEMRGRELMQVQLQSRDQFPGSEGEDTSLQPIPVPRLQTPAAKTSVGLSRKRRSWKGSWGLRLVSPGIIFGGSERAVTSRNEQPSGDTKLAGFAARKTRAQRSPPIGFGG